MNYNIKRAAVKRAMVKAILSILVHIAETFLSPVSCPFSLFAEFVWLIEFESDEGDLMISCFKFFSLVSTSLDVSVKAH